jgi:ribosomal protein S18 acetylase RimI-like enzyme
MPELTIRDASERDIDSVLDLWRTAGGVPGVSDTPAGLMCLLAADREALLVAESRGVIVGSLIAAFDGWRGSFYRLAIRPDHRRQGFATALLREGELRLQARGAVRLTAIVTAGDPAANAFWTAAGYERRDDQVRYVRRASG